MDDTEYSSDDSLTPEPKKTKKKKKTVKMSEPEVDEPELDTIPNDMEDMSSLDNTGVRNCLIVCVFISAKLL